MLTICVSPTHSPATMVPRTSVAGSVSGSWSSTTRSASKPARTRPRRSSSKLSHAGATVKDSSAAPAGTSSSAAARRPASGSSASTGASEPAAIRAPEASSAPNGYAWSTRSAQMRCTSSRSDTACEYCIDAVTPSAAKRGTSSGATHWACSMRWRAPGVMAASNASSASRLA